MLCKWLNGIFCYENLQSENIHLKSEYQKNTVGIRRYLEPIIPLVHHSRISGTHSVTSGAFLDEVVVCSPLTTSSESRSNNPEKQRPSHTLHTNNKIAFASRVPLLYCLDFFMIFTMTVSEFIDMEEIQSVVTL